MIITQGFNPILIKDGRIWQIQLDQKRYRRITGPAAGKKAVSKWTNSPDAHAEVEREYKLMAKQGWTE